jgi:hypothetical protein
MNRYATMFDRRGMGAPDRRRPSRIPSFRRKPESSVNRQEGWIPAFAGMTSKAVSDGPDVLLFGSARND